jgi:hypothetical protein
MAERGGGESKEKTVERLAVHRAAAATYYIYIG